MNNGSAGAVTPANTYSDKYILTNFHKYKKSKRLVLDGFNEDGKKIQKWENGAPDIDEHLDPSIKRNYGCN